MTMLFQRLVRTSRALGRVHLHPATARRWYAAETVNTAAIANAAMPAIKLREYQEECIQAVLEHQEQGHRRLGVSLATGGGKTVIFTELIGRVKPLSQYATQTLIIVHRRELVEQAARQCQRVYPDKVIEIEMGRSVSSGVADITIASILSLVSKDRIQKFDPKRFKLILIDEAHHAAARSYLDTLAYFGATTPDASVNLVGVSATMSRMDGVKLGSVMDHIVYHRNFVEMIDEGWLSQMIFTTVQTKVDLSQVKNSGADFNIGDLGNAVNTEEANELTVKSWISQAAGRKSTLVFCVDIAHTEAMTNKFRQHGFEAKYVTSETHVRDRGEILNDFRKGKFPVLVNCGVFTEGTDIPNIDCVVLARPTRSRNLLVQMIGRGMRLSPGKENCHVIDMLGSTTKGIVTTPTLYGLDPNDVVEKVSPEKMRELAEEKQLQQLEQMRKEAAAEKAEAEQRMMPVPRNVTFTHYDSIHDLVEDSRADEWIRQVSPFSWVGVGYGKYILQLKDRGFLRLEQNIEEKSFDVWYTMAIKSEVGLPSKYAPFRKPRLIVDGAEDLEQAVHAADTFAEGRVHRLMLLHSANWRSNPASEAQMKLLRRLLGEEQLKKKRYSMGLAGDIITKIKHGAKKELDKIQVQERKTRRESKRRSNAYKDTTVGPIESS